MRVSTGLEASVAEVVEAVSMARESGVSIDALCCAVVVTVAVVEAGDHEGPWVSNRSRTVFGNSAKAISSMAITANDATAAVLNNRSSNLRR
jgi:hypothetical protein